MRGEAVGGLYEGEMKGEAGGRRLRGGLCEEEGTDGWGRGRERWRRLEGG